MASLWSLRLFVLSLVAAALVSASAVHIPEIRPRAPSNNGKVCVVTPRGCNKDDVPQILQAFDDCNNGGTVEFLEGRTYYIATRLNPVIYDVNIEWRGLWLV